MSTKREHWQIQYGCSNYDSNRVDVICNEEELPIICAALVRYDEKERDRPIACVAKKGNGVSFSRYEDFDYQYCDCM